MNIVHVGAHGDDEARALGTLIKYRNMGGHKITLILTTNSDKGFSYDTQTPYDQVAVIRDQEMRAVADALGFDYICLGAADEFLYDTPEMRLKLIDALRACQADLIFTDWVHEYNLDHSTTSRLVFQAALNSVIASMKTDHPALRVTPKIFYCPPHGADMDFEGTHFVELSEEIVEEAARATRLHESQVRVFKQFFGGDLGDLMVREPARRNGARVGVRYADVFRPCLATRRTPLANMLP
jgi:LmbE family N-acetylglucosaminyl deacetylase